MFAANVVKKKFHLVLVAPGGTEVVREVEAESAASAYLSLPLDLRGPGWNVKEIEETPKT